MTKSEFLTKYGMEVSEEAFIIHSFESLSTINKMAVILVDNGLFDAAIKCVNDHEYEYVKKQVEQGNDARPMKIYFVPLENFKHEGE